METHPIAELLQAEKKAEQIKAKAHEEAQEKIERAKRDAENLLKKEEQQGRNESKELLEEALKAAQKEASYIRAKGQEQVLALKESSHKRMNKASTLLLDKLDKAI
jgi:vacuolar-type H+-ATPase subunit H